MSLSTAQKLRRPQSVHYSGPIKPTVNSFQSYRTSVPHSIENYPTPSAMYALRRMFEIGLATMAFSVRSLGDWVTGIAARKKTYDADIRTAVRLRETLQILGGTFVKFGQFLATRPDLLPNFICEELATLLDDVPPFSDATAERIVRDDLGDRAASLLQKPLNHPVAAGSFGQVYRVAMPNGQIVAVKVQRPEARRNTAVDLALLSTLAWCVDASTIAEPLSLGSFIHAFRKWTQEELDYLKEARAADKIRRDLLRDDSGRIAEEYYPKVYRGLTSSRVLTLEYIRGVWVSDLLDPKSEQNYKLHKMSPRSRNALCAQIFRAFLNQVFVDGFYHADPHPGNIAILDDGRIALVDFGISGTMSTGLQEHMTEMLDYASQNDTARTFNTATQMLNIPKETNIKLLKAEYEQNIENWYLAAEDPYATVSEKSFAALILRNVETVRKYGVSLPTNVFRYYRAFITLDGVLLQLFPDFNMAAELRSFLERIQLRKACSQISLRNYLRSLFEYQDLLLELPQNLSRVFDLATDVPEQIESFARKLRLFVSGLLSAISRLFFFGSIIVVTLLPFSKQYGFSISWSVRQRSQFAVVLIMLSLITGWLQRRVRFALSNIN
jgi:ubiquinone biosynthesis protein